MVLELMTFAAPFALLAILITLGFRVLAYPFRKTITLPNGAPVLLGGWLVSVPVLSLLVLLGEGATALIGRPEGGETWMAHGVASCAG